jgi:amino-acid N-acetyltransferase
MLQYRKATMADVPAIHQLIQHWANQGVMLRRPAMRIYEAARDFVVAVDDATGELAGVGGLHIMGQDLAEIRSLAVQPGRVGGGVGRGLVEKLMLDAADIGLQRVFALTYQQKFFERAGFHVVTKDSLPQKVWTECVYCDKFDNCEEIAVVRWVDPAHPDAPLVDEIPLIEKPHWSK